MSKDRNMNNIKSSVPFGINNSEDDIAYQVCLNYFLEFLI